MAWLRFLLGCNAAGAIFPCWSSFFSLLCHSGLHPMHCGARRNSQGDGPLCTGGAGVRGFSWPAVRRSFYLSNNAVGAVLPPAGQVFFILVYRMKSALILVANPIQNFKVSVGATGARYEILIPCVSVFSSDEMPLLLHQLDAAKCILLTACSIRC